MVRNTRVDYIGKHTRFAGLKGTVTAVYDMGVTVLWDDGVTFPHYWEEVCAVSAAKPATETMQADPVNQPQHYQFFPDLEAIEVIARSTTQEQFYGYCLGNRLKYRLRAGNKDKLEQDIAKSDKYLELYEQYKGLCYGAVDVAVTPVPMPTLEDW